MSPTTIYDPEVITTTPTKVRLDRRASRPAPSRPPKLSPKILATLLLIPSVTIIFAAMILCAEFVLGAVGLGDDEYIKVDPILGITHLENKWVDFRHEGFSRDKISSAGLRDVEHQVAKPEGVKRIAFIGDSKTQALQVNIADTFVRLVEDQLNAAAADGTTLPSETPQKQQKRFETINFGMSSYGLVQYFVQYLTRVRPYAPDVTVVVYHIFDSSENIPKFGTATLPAPTVSMNNKGDMAIDYNFLDGWLYTSGARYLISSEWWRRNSHLFQALSADDFMLRNSSKWYVNILEKIFSPFERAYENAMSKVSLTAFGDYQATRRKVQEEVRALDKQVSHESMWPWTLKVQSPANPASGADSSNEYKMLHNAASADALIAGRIFRMLNLACRKADSKLVVVTLPAPDNMVFYIREIQCLKQLAKEEGFTVIDAHSEFPLLAPMEPSPLYYRSHFSPAGHRKLAGVIVDGLKPILK